MPAKKSNIETKQSNRSERPPAMITGASTGIGHELAICCATEESSRWTKHI